MVSSSHFADLINDLDIMCYVLYPILTEKKKQRYHTYHFVAWRGFFVYKILMKYRIVPETVMESAHLKIWRGHVLECCLNLLIIEKKNRFLNCDLFSTRSFVYDRQNNKINGKQENLKWKFNFYQLIYDKCHLLIGNSTVLLFQTRNNYYEFNLKALECRHLID